MGVRGSLLCIYTPDDIAWWYYSSTTTTYYYYIDDWWFAATLGGIALSLITVAEFVI